LTHNFLQNALGAQLLQAGPLLYLSPQSGAGVPARGGVPVLFPQFADTGPLPKHGWARNLPWDCVAQTATSSHFRLVAAPGAHATWQHHGTLDLHTTVGPGSLHQTLTVHNTGNQAFGWTGGHRVYAVDGVEPRRNGSRRPARLAAGGLAALCVHRACVREPAGCHGARRHFCRNADSDIAVICYEYGSYCRNIGEG
jgi:hypothetical protein